MFLRRRYTERCMISLRHQDIQGGKIFSRKYQSENRLVSRAKAGTSRRLIMLNRLKHLSFFLLLMCMVMTGAGLTEGPKATKPAMTSAKPSATATAKPDPDLDLTKQPTLFVVGYAHLDTEWRWEYPQVIREYLPKTLHDNFDLFGKYPHYIFNFSGANRYRMMKEYYPADYARLQQFVAAGRWFPAGSSMEESDVNSPSAESIFRQVLYGNQYFRRDFNKTSAEYMLPDCFGFPAS